MENLLKSKNYNKVEIITQETLLSTLDIFDDFLSFDKGFVLGSTILLTGTPGAGKTTLAVYLQNILKNYITSLYEREVSGSAVVRQTKRLRVDNKNAFIADKKTHSTFNEYVKEIDILKPQIVIIDSLQVIAKEDFTEMSEASAAYHIMSVMSEWAEKNNACVILIGHVTKDGVFSGKNTNLQMVHGHIEMIYNKEKNERTIQWSTKNRYGDITKILFYELNDAVDFFTVDQWNLRKREISFEDMLMDTVKRYINAIDHKNENYPEFHKEFKKRMKVIFASEDTDIIKVSNVVKTVEELVAIFKLV